MAQTTVLPSNGASKICKPCKRLNVLERRRFLQVLKGVKKNSSCEHSGVWDPLVTVFTDLEGVSYYKAAKFLNETLKILKRKFGLKHKLVINGSEMYAEVLSKLRKNKRDELKIKAELKAIELNVRGIWSDDIIWNCFRDLGRFCMQLGKYIEAELYFRRALKSLSNHDLAEANKIKRHMKVCKMERRRDYFVNEYI